jgi:hypothetical protein
MRFKRMTRIAAAVAVIGAVAAGGAAFTDTTGQAGTQTLGYGQTTVTGGTITGLSYQLNAAGDTVSTVTLTSDEDLETSNNGGASTILLDFNGDNHFGSGGDASCAITASSATAPIGSTVTCTITGGKPVANIQSVEISITDGTETY